MPSNHKSIYFYFLLSTAIATVVISIAVMLGWIIDFKPNLSVFTGAATLKFNGLLFFGFRIIESDFNRKDLRLSDVEAYKTRRLSLEHLKISVKLIANHHVRNTNLI